MSLGISILERAMGIEPTSKAWEALVLPMNYARLLLKSSKQMSRRAVRQFEVAHRAGTKCMRISSFSIF